MTVIPFALYDAFSHNIFGGSQAGIVCNAAGLDAGTRLQIAQEFGWPATCFVTKSSANSISARFCSPIREYPMCGHGTVCLMTMMLERGVLEWNHSDRIDVKLCLPASTAMVEIHRRNDGRAQVMLDIEPPFYRRDELDISILTNLLGLKKSDLVRDMPLETAIGDFTHLLVPVKGLGEMGSINPDFDGLTDYCKNYEIDTVAVFCTEVEHPQSTVHVRDFCPAVGVAESAAAGTTNAALAGYLVRHGLVAADRAGNCYINAEQGIEMDRPSELQSVVCMQNGTITGIQTGGVATMVLEGQLHLPIVRMHI
jgi:trans-2,3-dihydro-3-hydroxyanthranilate isomerase